MNKLQLLYSSLLGIVSATVAFVVFSMSQLQTDLDTVSRQLVDTNKAFATAMANPHNKASQSSKNQLSDADSIKGIISDLADQIATIDSRLNELDTDITDVHALLAEVGAEEQYSDEQEFNNNDMAHTAAAYTPEPVPMTAAQRTALLEYALTDPISEDPVWSDTTVLQVEEIFTQSPSLKLATSYNVSCGGQICKIKSTLPKDASLMEKEMFDMNLMADIGTILDRSVLQENILPDGSVEFTHYISRKGHYLPTEGGGLVETKNDDES